MLGFWGWVLVVIVLWAIFDFNNLPKYKEKLGAFLSSNTNRKTNTEKDSDENK